MNKNKIVRNNNHVLEVYSKGMVIFVTNVVLYLMAKQNVALAKADVELCDVANVYCEDETIRAKVEAIKVHRFRHEGEPRVVVSVLKIIEQITKLCPGVTVESIGETDIIIQKASLEHDKPEQKYSPWAYIKIAIVAATQIERLENPDTKGATENSAGVFRCLNPQKLYETVARANANNDKITVCLCAGNRILELLRV